MRIRLLWVITLSMVIENESLLAAPVRLPGDGKDEIKRLEGEWTVTGWNQGGDKLTKDDLMGSRWVVKGDKYTFQMGDNQEEGTIKVDPGKKVAEIDLAIKSGPDEGKPQVGIYRVDKDGITFCFARPGAKERPTEFKATEDNGFILMTVKRPRDD